MVRYLAAAAAALLASTAAVAPAQEAYSRDVVVTASRTGSGWFEATSKHFVIYMRDTAQHVGQYAARMEKFDKAIRVLHGTPEDNRGSASRVTVYVLDSASDVQSVAHNTRVLGFYEPNTHAIAVMPRNSGDSTDYGLTAQAVMFHEYTHHWMLTNWVDAALPAWYTEGNAELHATAIVRPDGSFTFGAIPTYRQYGVGYSDIFPAERLLRGVPGKLNDKETQALYARGWLLSHYLTFDAERRGLLARYVAAVNSGKSVNEAAAVLGNVGALDGKMNAYGRRSALPSLTMSAADLPVGPVTVRALSPAEAAMVPAVVRSRSGVDKSVAPGVLAMALNAAAPYPNDPAAQNEIAEAEYDVASLGPEAAAAAGYQRAAAAADRVLAVDPKSVHALLYRGMAEQGIAEATKKTDEATWRAVRAWYIKANRADTEDPLPLLIYYASFRANKQAPTAGALAGVIYAYALAPHSIDARLAVTKVLLTQGKLHDARTALAPVAYRADLGQEQTKTLLKILAAIDTSADAALAAVKEAEDKADADRDKARKKA